MKLLAATLMSVIAISAFADTNSDSGYYVGLGVSSTKSDVGDFKFTPAEIFGGYKLNPFVGGEIRIGASAGGSDKVTNFESIYYRVESANTVGKTYLIAGYTHAEMETKYGNFNLSGFSYGAGVGFIINEDFNLNLEYKVLATGESNYYPNKFTKEKMDLKLSSVSATVDYRF